MKQLIHKTFFRQAVDKIVYVCVVLFLVSASCEKDEEISPPVANTVPSKPVLSSPTNGAVEIAPNTKLVWKASTDADGDDLKYDVFVGENSTPTDAVSSGQTESEYTPKNQKRGTKYSWRVQVTDGTASLSSETWSYTTSANQSPKTFSVVSPAQDAKDISTTPKLVWKKTTDPEGDPITYEIFISDVDFELSITPAVAKGITDTSYTLTKPLKNSTTYKWKVVAHDDNGGTGQTARFSFTTEAASSASSPPSKPTYKAPANNSNSLFGETLSWNASTVSGGGTVKYNVYWDTITPPTTRVASAISATTFDTKSLYENNKTYYWHIEAISGSDTTKGDIWKYETGTSSVNAPTNIKQLSNSGTTVTVGWDAVSSASKYYIDLAFAPLDKFDALTGYTNLEIDGSATSYTFTGLDLATSYQARIRVLTPDGKSDNSTSTLLLTSWRAPKNVTVSNVQKTSFDINFTNPDNDPSRDTYLRLELSKTSDYSTLLKQSGDISSGINSGVYNVDGLEPGVTYYYRIYYSSYPSIDLYPSTKVGGQTVTKPPSAPCPSNVTFNGTTYKTVKIGSQCWMAENLNDDNHTSGNSYCYENKADTCEKYGRLYDNDAAVDIANKLSGWHLPTEDEWALMFKTVGSSNIKELQPGGSSGFDGLFGGSRASNGTYSDLGSYGRYRSSTSGNNNTTSSPGHTKWFDIILYSFRGHSEGLSVRLIQDI